MTRISRKQLATCSLIVLISLGNSKAEPNNPLVDAAINPTSTQALPNQNKLPSYPNRKSSPLLAEASASDIDPVSSTSTTVITAPPPLSEPSSNPVNHSLGLRPYVQENTPAKKITLNFTNIQTRVLLQLFAQFTGLNFIISDKVISSMSIHLKNVAWPQALNLILKSQRLAELRIGDNVIVGPIAEIQQTETDDLKRKQQLAQLRLQDQVTQLENATKLQDAQPLISSIIHLQFAKASDVAKMLSTGSMLSGRSKLSADDRSNSLIIKDTETYLTRARRLIRQLDHPEKQVAIDARIVSIDRPFERTLGIRWGVTSISPNHLSGTLEGANQGLIGGTPTSIPLAQRLNFDAKAPQINLSNPASVGIALARLGDYDVDLELSALENEGKLVLISKPRLVTSNMQTATIATGQEIPYQEATSSGATAVSFKNATLSLKVTPRIASNTEVLLEITVTNNTAGTPVPLSGGGSAIPINTQEETSTILVKTGQTIVLGGVYKQEKGKTVLRIPFLGRIPLLGYLFKQTTYINNRNELLIFITPKIIDTPRDLNRDF